MDYTQKEYKIMLSVEKFKEILIHSWELLPPEKQQELREIGICPEGNNN